MAIKATKFTQIVERLTLERKKVVDELQAQFERKHELQRKLFDQTIPHKEHQETKEMLDITNELISDLALEVGVWEQAREVIFNVMED